jgi:hypothetical protein
MSGITELFTHYKDILGFAGSTVAGVLGIGKTVSEIIRGRSRASQNEKLLSRIQSLLAVRQAMAAGSLPVGVSIAPIDADLAVTLRDFAQGSAQQKERQELKGDLSLFERVFLLYRPVGVRTWVAQCFFWLLCIFLPLAFMGTWFSEDSEEPALAAFKANWKDPGIIFTFLFFFGLLLLSRSWAVSERRKYLEAHGSLPGRMGGFGFGTLAAILYGALGIAAVVGGIFMIREDLHGGLKICILGLVVAGCGLTLRAWDSLSRRSGRRTMAKAMLLASPAFLLMVAFIFNIDGIVLKTYAHDLLGYWHQFASEPIIPFVILPAAALPLYAAFRCVRAARGQQLSSG